MSTAIRVSVGVAGVAVVATATAANVAHAGGWGSADAPIMVAVAALLALGTAGAVVAWREGQLLGAVALALCLIAGEGYVLAVTAERELAAREERAAPLVEAQAQRVAAEKRLADAEAGARAAIKAQRDKAAENGCRKECAALLRDDVARADRELIAAREAVAALPAVRSVAPLAERVGVPSWAWELILAVLRSIAVSGGSIAVALAMHGPGRRRDAVSSDAAGGSAGVLEVVAMPATENEDWPSVAPVALPSPKPARTATRNAAREADRFGGATLVPAAGAVTSAAALRAAYVEWCGARELEPLPTKVIAPALGAMFRKAGVVMRDGAVHGLAIRETTGNAA